MRFGTSFNNRLVSYVEIRYSPTAREVSVLFPIECSWSPSGDPFSNKLVRALLYSRRHAAGASPPRQPLGRLELFAVRSVRATRHHAITKFSPNLLEITLLVAITPMVFRSFILRVEISRRWTAAINSRLCTVHHKSIGHSTRPPRTSSATKR